MAPTIHFIRHGQGFHNLGGGDYNMHDPLLTAFGMEQCAQLAKTFPNLHDVDLVVSSPSKRTIYTALLAFGEAIDKKNLTIIGLPELQETSDLPCDIGSDCDKIRREFKTHRLDLSQVTDDWTSKKGKWAPTPEATEERCRVARNWLRSRPESNIVVITHGGVLHYLTEDWEGSNKFAGGGWVNAEFRSYTFNLRSGERASLVETPESRNRRKAPEKALSDTEQRDLRLIAEANWAKDGYIAPKKKLDSEST
jgi:broad specificity phosphatase PhoE